MLLVMHMLLTRVRHKWPEAKGFQLVRPKGYPEYTFLHFLTPVTLQLGDTSIAVTPGGCVFFPPGMPQFFSAETALVHDWFHAAAGLGVLLERYGLPRGQVFYPTDDGFISELLQKTELEYFSDNQHKEILLDGYLQELLILLSRKLRAAPPPLKNADLLHMREMRQRILSQPKHRWTVEEMAGLVGLSTSRFHAVYKALFGISPMQDLIEARTEAAKNRLLLLPDASLSEIAEALGYNDQFHFIRQFRKETGMTPGQFRKENQ